MFVAGGALVAFDPYHPVEKEDSLKIPETSTPTRVCGALAIDVEMVGICENLPIEQCFW